jgi:hypothetical protein
MFYLKNIASEFRQHKASGYSGQQKAELDAGIKRTCVASKHLLRGIIRGNINQKQENRSTETNQKTTKGQKARSSTKKSSEPIMHRKKPEPGRTRRQIARRYQELKKSQISESRGHDEPKTNGGERGKKAPAQKRKTTQRHAKSVYKR